MFHNEKELLSRIAEASNAIRRKHRMLKLGKETSEQNAREFFKPMINPIEKLVTNENKKDELKNKKVKLEAKQEYLNNLENVLNEKEEVLDSFLNKSRGRNNNLEYDDDNDSFASAYDDDEIFNSTKKQPATKKQMLNIKHEKIFDNRRDSLLEDNFSNNPIKEEKNKKDFKTLFDDLMSKAAQKHKQFDTQAGVRRLQEGMKIGDSRIKFQNDKIIVGDIDFEPTFGLLELLFKKSPDENLIQEMDVQVYKSILMNTNAHKKHYNSNSAIREDNTDKFKKYISKMFESRKKGEGILPRYMIERAKKRKIDYLYWDDPNELVERLQLLIGSKSAGHSNHDNEIMSIIEELRESNIIY